MAFKKVVKVSVDALLGAVVGNLIYHLLRSYRQAQQVKVGELPDTEVMRAWWVPQSTVAATFLASRVEHRPGALGFLLGMAFALVAVAATGPRALPATPSTIVSQ